MRSLECLEGQKSVPLAHDHAPQVEIVVPVRDKECDLGPGGLGGNTEWPRP